MRYSVPSRELFIKNRKKFVQNIKPGHCAAFFANPMVNDNADSTYPFEQNSNTYYLSGIDQEEIVLFLFPDAPKKEWREILFIRKTNKTIQIWEGWKYSIEEAQAASGVETIKYFEEFEPFFASIAKHCLGVYLDFNEHSRNSVFTYSPAHEFAQRLKLRFPAHEIQRSSPILDYLRSKKEPEEITQIQKACDITEKAFRRVLEFTKPGKLEYEIEAEIIHEFIRNGADGHAYSPIIASGASACVLHYNQNDKVCNDGDVMLMDFGSAYGNYSSDLSRSIPINGKFTQRQKDVYNAVLRVMKEAKKLLVPGTIINDYNVQVGEMMQEELLELGLLKKEDIANQNPDYPAYKKYFMHGTSHFMGLDTHDLGNFYKPIEAGMVFTCEPGIYILGEGLGIRLENDILVTENEPKDLMVNIPIEAEEIEDLMNK